MKRPSEHVKEEISSRILESKIPPEWILREIKPDYGIDKSLEIVENGVVTGKEILIQLKGTNVPNFNKEYFNFRLKTYQLKYYEKRDIPVVLIVVDIKNEICYWIFLQQYIFDTLNIKKPSWKKQKTVRIKIPIKQKLNNNLDQIIDIAKGGSAFIISRKINQIPSNYLARWKNNAEAIIEKSKVAKNFMEKSFHLKFEISYNYDKEGNHDKSIGILKEVREIAISANDKNNIVKSSLLLAYQYNSYNQNEIVWNILIDIKEIVEELNDNNYNILWHGSIHETLYIRLIQKYNSLLRLSIVSSIKPKNIMTPFLVLRIHEIVSQIYDVEIEFIKLLNKAYDDEEYLIYIDFLKRLAKMHYIWVYNNSIKGNQDVIFNQLKKIENMLLYTIDISHKISDDFHFLLLLDLIYLYHSMEKFTLRDSTIDKAKKIAKKLEHIGYLNTLDGLNEFFEKSYTISYLIKYDEVKSQQKDISEEEEVRFIKALLKNGGIDFESGDDDLARLARIGLKDRNPERILKHCENLYIELVIYGPIWNTVALPETGMKILFCDKKGSIMGYSLDELLDRFKNSYCRECKCNSPRSRGWKWSKKWQLEREKPEGMMKAINNFRNIGRK